MPNSQDLTALFPSASTARELLVGIAPVHQRAILLDGELKNWDGPRETVRSAICARQDDGRLKQIELGSYPRCELPEAQAALQAAVAAYDDGRGEWPTMTAAERVGCLQEVTRALGAP